MLGDECKCCKTTGLSRIGHKPDCVVLTGKLGEDYVICAICGVIGRSLKKHITWTHNYTPEQYEDYVTKHGRPICTNAKAAYHATKNYDWIRKANEEGRDLSEYKKTMSKAVSTAIMNKPEERSRRSKLMTKMNNEWWKDKDYAQMISDVAANTSARPDVVAARTKQLHNWRTNNPDELAAAIEHSLEVHTSRPEMALFDIVKSTAGYCFKHNTFIKDPIFTSKTQRKQLDIADLARRVVIEFDGIMHFKEITRQCSLERAHEVDEQLNTYAIRENFMLIRIGYDQWDNHRGGFFKPECLKKLFELLTSPNPGVYKLGTVYGEDNLM